MLSDGFILKREDRCQKDFFIQLIDYYGLHKHRQPDEKQLISVTAGPQEEYEKSNFKIAIVVDMWLTGFDVPFLDSIYIDKPIQQHNLIQTISRVHRKRLTARRRKSL